MQRHKFPRVPQEGGWCRAGYVEGQAKDANSPQAEDAKPPKRKMQTTQAEDANHLINNIHNIYSNNSLINRLIMVNGSWLMPTDNR